MKKHVLSFKEFIHESINVALKENLDIKSGRFLDKILPMNESYSNYFKQSNELKDTLDEIICKKILSYSTTPLRTINEGWWSDLVDTAKEIGGKAIDAAKTVVKNIGSFFKHIIEVIVKSLTLAAGASYPFIKKYKNNITDKAKGKIDKEKLNKEKIVEDVKVAGEHSAFFIKGGPFKKQLEESEKQNKGNIDKASQEFADKGEQESIAKTVESYSSIINFIKDDEYLLEYFKSGFKNKKLFETEVNIEAKPTEIKDDEVGKNKLWSLVAKVSDFLTIGLVKGLEELLKKAQESFYEKFTGWQNKRGGPKASKLEALSLIIATVIGIMAEIGTKILKDKVGGVCDIIYEVTNYSNPLGILNMILKSILHNSTLYWVILIATCLLSVFVLLEELELLSSDKVKEVTAGIKIERESELAKAFA